MKSLTNNWRPVEFAERGNSEAPVDHLGQGT